MKDLSSEKATLQSERFEIVRAQESVLETFSPEQQVEIKKRLNVLSSIVYFVGKDFEITIELNQPGKGWHWDFKDNIVRVDPKDLLDRPIEYSCFVMAHEAGHRRISRTHFIPDEVWQKPGFPFLMNAIEDPRENNFVADNYPAFAERMELAYKADLDLEEKSQEKAIEKIGKVPQFMQAGFEYIRLWFLERINQTDFVGLDQEEIIQKLKSLIKPELPEEVKDVIIKTIEQARDSWWTYPTRKEADSSEQNISDYAEASYQINLEKIWPEFSKLVEKDIQDETTRQLLEDMKKQKGEKKDKSESDRDENQDDQDGQGQPTPEEIQKALDEMSDEQKKELEEKAKKMMDELSKEIAKEMQGQLNDNPDERKENLTPDEEKEKTNDSEEKENKDRKEQKEKTNDSDEKERQKEIEKIRKRLKEISEKDQNRYERDRVQVSTIINKLRDELYSIFSERRKTKTKKGFKSGRTINLGKRITEIAKGILPIESSAWEKKERPTEKDYAFSILVDLSGSMQGEKIRETFKAAIVLSEVLNSLGIKFEVLGFHDQIREFLNFGQKLSDDIRKEIQTMLSEVDSSNANWNDDGWALTEASKRLEQRKEQKKFLIVLSDGEPYPSNKHSGSKFELDKVIKEITKEADHELIGLGIGRGTEHVAKYYPQNIANIDIKDLPSRLAKQLKDLIERD